MTSQAKCAIHFSTGSGTLPDEVRQSRTIAQAVQSARQQIPGVRTSTIIVGYSSGEVREELGKVVDCVLVFDEDRFLREFEGFVRANQSAVVEQTVRSQEAVYQQLQARFDEIEQRRQAEGERLSKLIETMQSRASRQYDSERERRVTDKVSAILDNLSDLLRREEGMASRGLSESNASGHTSFQMVLRILDEQREQLRKAEFLSRNLSPGGAFEYVASQYSKILDDAEQLWVQANDPKLPGLFLDSIMPLPDVRSFFRRRRDILNELQVHYENRSRWATKVFGPFTVKAVVVTFFILLGFSIDTILLTLTWQRQSRLLDGYRSTIQKVQESAFHVRGKIPSYQRTLDNSSKSPQQIPEISTLADFGASVQSAYSAVKWAHLQDPDLDNAQSQLMKALAHINRTEVGISDDVDAVIDACDKIMADLESRSVASFVITQSVRHPALWLGLLLPLLSPFLISIVMRPRPPTQL